MSVVKLLFLSFVYRIPDNHIVRQRIDENEYNALSVQS
jgi:hypothetical protein